MGYTTDFVGHIDIEPSLNQDEMEYLSAFSLSRRFDRPEGPYAVPGNPMAALDTEHETVDIGDLQPRRSRPAAAAVPVGAVPGRLLPGLRRAREVLRARAPGCVTSSSTSSSRERRLSRSGLPAFEHFTFDHRLDGMVVGCRRDTKELFAIQVKGQPGH